jgi:mono/diheme cytochrome c family protein
VRQLLAPALLAGALLLTTGGSAAGQLADQGQAIFEQKCASCHTLGGGQLVGPDLEGVIERLGGADQVRAFILAPDQVRPGTAMPNLGLSEEEVAALVAYFEAQGGAPPVTEPATTTAPEPATTTAPTAPVTGAAALGHDLFTGSDRLENGGPPCLSCHSVAGIGALGGGQLGPDLTNAFTKYGGEQGLAGVLQTIAFPTMLPIYSDQPLTEAEVANLVAFLAEAPTAERSAGSVGILIGIAIGVVALFGVIAYLIWKGRLIAVRRTLVHRPNPRQK